MPLAQLPIIGCNIGKPSPIKDENLALEVQTNKKLILMCATGVWGTNFQLMVHPKAEEFIAIRDARSAKDPAFDKRVAYIIKDLTIGGEDFDAWFAKNNTKGAIKTLQDAILARFINSPTVHSRFFNATDPLILFVDINNEVCSDAYVVVTDKDKEADAPAAEANNSYFAWLPSLRMW